jgi:hypothetical protein
MANNTFVDSPYAMGIGSRGAYAPTDTGFDVVNNIFLHHRRFVHSIDAPQILQGSARIDYNLYYLNGYEAWPQHTPGIMAGDVTSNAYQELPKLADVRAAINQEAHGVEGDPALASYDPNVTDGRWQDFRLTATSTLAIDQGVELPASLQALLAKFGIDTGQKGAALDLGAIEFDPTNPNAPLQIDVGPRDAGTAPATVPWSIPGSVDGGATTPTGTAGTGGSGGCGCSLLGKSPAAGLSWWCLLALGIAKLTSRRVRKR